VGVLPVGQVAAVEPAVDRLDDPQLLGFAFGVGPQQLLDRRVLGEQAVPVVVAVDLDRPEQRRDRCRGQQCVDGHLVVLERLVRRDVTPQRVEGVDRALRPALEVARERRRRRDRVAGGAAQSDQPVVAVRQCG